MWRIRGLGKAIAMSEGSYPTEPVTDSGETGGQSQAETGDAPASGAPDAGPPERPSSVSDATSRRVVFMLALVIIVGLPVGVGLATYLSRSAPSDVVPEPSALAELTSDAPSRGADTVNLSDPRWTRPTWAEGLPEVTVFELSAGSDVLFANGRHRPSLGISCVDGRTDVHVTTGGTAPIDPETSGHVVNITFDNRNAQPQQWVAAQDQRALFAPDSLRFAGQVASARRLLFGFTHYMSGPVEVEFDLRGANDVITSMAEPCGWGG